MAESEELKGSRKEAYEIIKRRKRGMSISEIRYLTKMKYNTLRGHL